MGTVLGDAMHAEMRDLPNVIGVRSLGLAAAVELKGITGSPGKRAYDIFLECYHNGVMVRPAGENLVLAPPFIVETSHIDQMVSTLGAAIRKHS